MERALIACSLWLHLGFVGAAVLAAGLLQLFGGEVNWASALALALSGTLLAAGSWRRARNVFERAEQASVAASEPAPSASPERIGRGTMAMLSAISAASDPETR